MTEIRLEGIKKRFGKTEVLKGIDLTIQRGEFFTIVGPSGCGKSTILNLIAGLDEPTEGGILFDGHSVKHLSARDRDVAVVFQSYALYPHMTVYENIAFPLRMRKLSSDSIEQRVLKAADPLGLMPFLQKKPRQLSGGQQQRVALGRAMVRNPRVFLLDEPLSNLDAQLRVQMRSELKQLQRRLGVTMVYVTHDQAEAMTLSDRLAVLHQGVIQQIGPPRGIYERPANQYVAGFIGNPPMNLLQIHLNKDPETPDSFRGSFPFFITSRILERMAATGPAGCVILGVRPEHLRVLKPSERLREPVLVSLIEPMGSEDWVELSWRDQRLRAKTTSPFEMKIGEPVHLEADEDRVHLFEPSAGRRID